MIAWCVLVFMALHSVRPTWANFAPFGYFPDSSVFSGRWYAFITSAFVHIDAMHLIFNMYWLWILGLVLEKKLRLPLYAIFIVAAAFVSSGWQFATGEMGIGFSGVGYAMVGYGWIAKKSNPELAPYFSDRVLMLFGGWGLLCIVADAVGLMRIGNVAHIVGLGFGVLFALVENRRNIFAGIGLMLLFTGAITTIFWNPLLPSWLYDKGATAMIEQRYDEAANYFVKSMNRGGDEASTLRNLAEIYGYQDKKSQYADALRRLKKLSPKDAKEVIEKYGPP